MVSHVMVNYLIERVDTIISFFEFVDIDECNLNLSMCHPDSYCDNTIGSYLCICNVGYSGDGFDNCSSKCLWSYNLYTA